MEVMWYWEGVKRSVSFSSTIQTSDVAIAPVLALHTILPVAMSPVASLSDYGLVSFQIEPSCSL